MITARFEKYCENCPEIEPTTNIIYAWGGVFEIEISCKHKDKCYQIYNAMKEGMKNATNDND